MGGPYENPKCTQCPGKCSYGKHIHIFEMLRKVKDVERMNRLQKELDQTLRGCTRLERSFAISSFLLNLLDTILSVREQYERQIAVFEAEIRDLKKDEQLIGKKTTALAIIYKNRCLVDKSKSDAVKIYLTYQIKRAETEQRHQDLALLKQELIYILT